MRYAAYAVGAFLLSCAVQSPVFAQDAKQEVSYRDLDLSTANGRRILSQRLQQASQQVCGKAEVRDLDAMRDMNRCRRVALDTANRTATELAARNAGSGQAFSSVSAAELQRVPR